MQISPVIQRKALAASAAVGGFIASATTAFAAPVAIELGSQTGQQSGFFSNSTDLVNALLKVVMVIGVLLVFAFLVMGGIEYITSGGEKGKTEAARNKITSAVIGLIILASSYAILTIILGFLKTDASTVLKFGG